MTTKIITVAAAGSVPVPSSGADYNKGAQINAVEFDQNIVNLRNAVDTALAALAGYSAGNASGNIPISNGTVNTNLNADMVDGFHASQTPGVNQVPVLNSAATLPVNGITFPATQVASSDPNTLDDYEEGAFTGVLTGSTSGAMANVSGRYTKVGNVCICRMEFVQSITAGTLVGTLTMTSLPFISKAVPPGIHAVFPLPYLRGMTATTTDRVMCAIVAGTSAMKFFKGAFGNISDFPNAPATFDASNLTQNGSASVLFDLTVIYEV